MAGTLPTIAIIGRPNVGKSTLFNRIVGRRIAVVEDVSGVTRDRLYAEAQYRGRRFQVIDTGGILFSDDDPLTEQVRVQAELAMAEADVIMFVVDAEQGIHPGDIEIADHLRPRKGRILVVANKSDNPDRERVAAEFYSFGLGDVHAVSAIHGHGIPDLMDTALEDLPKISETDEEPDDLKLAIVGRPNVGKSSLLNALYGESRAIVSDIPGTTRDALDATLTYKGRLLHLIDTAGIRRRGKIQGSIEYYMVLRAQQAMERADCALVLIDGVEGLTDGDKRVAKAAHELGKPTVLVVNKWDEREPPDGNLGRSSPVKKEFMTVIRNEIPELSYAMIRFSSAKEATGLEGIIKAAEASITNWAFRASTGVLNRLIQDAVFEKPLSRKGRPFKVYYCTQPETKPPKFVVFCNDPNLLHFSYQRYLENCLRKTFPLDGTPIRVEARRSKKDSRE